MTLFQHNKSSRINVVCNRRHQLDAHQSLHTSWTRLVCISLEFNDSRIPPASGLRVNFIIKFFCFFFCSVLIAYLVDVHLACSLMRTQFDAQQNNTQTHCIQTMWTHLQTAFIFFLFVVPFITIVSITAKETCSCYISLKSCCCFFQVSKLTDTHSAYIVRFIFCYFSFEWLEWRIKTDLLKCI